jgi:hypothetical protein
MKPNPQTTEILSIAGLFGRVMGRVLLAWMLLTLASSVAVLMLKPELTQPAILIALASGAISICALIPGMSLGTSGASAKTGLSRQRQIKRSGLFIVGAIAAMIIRVLGTVALLVVCRYHMGVSLETLVFFVCGWYLTLTGFEVFWLAKSAALLDVVPAELSLAAPDAFVDGTDF